MVETREGREKNKIGRDSEVPALVPGEEAREKRLEDDVLGPGSWKLPGR